jgi:predicted PurR-regulated permease PerM
MPEEETPQEDDLKTKINKFAFGSVETFGKYLAGKTVASIIVGAGTWIFCWLLGIKPAWLLGPIAGLGNLIPIAGPWAVLIICALVTVFQEPINALYIVIFCLGIQALDQFLITPLIVGKSISLSPFIIIAVVVTGSMFLGFWGLIFAIPVAAVIKLAYTIFIRKKDKGRAPEGTGKKA